MQSFNVNHTSIDFNNFNCDKTKNKKKPSGNEKHFFKRNGEEKKN